MERRRAEELAIELARTKDEFLALVTHELRNPLAVITSTAEVFDEETGNLTTDQRLYLTSITASAQRLSMIVDDLLDLARLESGNLAINPQATDLCAVIDAAVIAVGPQASAKNLTLVVQVADCLPLCGDPNRLRQVADNLLSNAIKYTPDGGTVNVTAAAGSRDDITWTVADTGIGIPEADRPRLFRRFYRASTALDHKIPGTGLGLVITRAIIERHRGTIRLSPHITRGTTFVIHLPVDPTSATS